MAKRKTNKQVKAMLKTICFEWPVSVQFRFKKVTTPRHQRK